MDLIKSIWEITFVPTTGSSVTLLAFGDYLTAEPEIKCTQQQLLQSVIQPDTEEAKKIGFSEKARLFVQGDKFLTNFGLEG